LPNLQKLGLGDIIEIEGILPEAKPLASYGKMAEISPAKDSTVGHWELMGHPVNKPFPTYPAGFPDETVKKLEAETGKKFLGNKPASGTEIIAELGKDHLRTGSLILYTSADSVLQIAAHEEIVPVEELYRVCKIARKIMTGEHSVGRIIARPFVGTPGNFTRTSRRHDFSLEPPNDTLLDILQRNNIPTIGIGKIYDLFGGKGISKSYPAKSNAEGINTVLELLKEKPAGLLFANLVDFDMMWGHRNDTQGFYAGLQEFDLALPRIMDGLNSGELVIITADHGVDPTTPSTDHSREYVPVLALIKGRETGTDLGIRKCFADVGATVGEFFRVKGTGWGESFLKNL
jgi:phosphopentomutase